MLATLPSLDLVVYLVWVPEMGGSAEQAAIAASRFVDPRITHYWDGEGGLGWAAGRALELPGRRGQEFGSGWDLYLLYPPGQRWSEVLPQPIFWMSGLMLVTPEAALEFDGRTLRAAVERVLAGRPVQKARRASEDAPLAGSSH